VNDVMLIKCEIKQTMLNDANRSLKTRIEAEFPLRAL